MFPLVSRPKKHGSTVAPPPFPPFAANAGTVVNIIAIIAATVNNMMRLKSTILFSTVGQSKKEASSPQLADVRIVYVS